MMLKRFQVLLLCVAALLVARPASAVGPLWFSPAPWGGAGARAAAPPVTPAHHKLGANIPIPSCSTAGTVLTCGGTGVTPSWASVTASSVPGTGITGGTANQLLDTNNAGSASEWFTLAGDGTFANHNLTVTGLKSYALPALTTGYLEWNGTAWTFGTGGGTVTWAGDLAGSSGTAQYVASISGSNATGVVVPLNTIGLQFASSITSASISQATQASTAAPPNLVLKPQFQSGSDEGSASANTPGSVVVNLGVPYTSSHAGSEAGFVVERNGSFVGSIQGWTNGPTSYGTLYLGPGITPAGTNYTILSDGTSNTYFNSPGSSGQIHFQIANTDYYEMAKTYFAPAADNAYANGTNGSRWQYAATGPLGFLVYNGAGNSNPIAEIAGSSGEGMLALGYNGNTPDVYLVREGSAEAQLSNGLNGNFELDVGGLSSANEISIISSTPKIIVAGTGTSGAQSTSLYIGPQVRSSGSSSTGGNVIVPLQSPVSPATTIATLETTLDGTQSSAMGAYSASYGGWWGMVGTPTTSNFAIISNGSSTQFNATSSLDFDISGSANIVLSSGVLYPYTAGGVAAGSTTNPFGSTFFGANSTYYTSVESTTGTHDNQTAHLRREQVLYEQTSFGTQVAGSGSAGSIFCPPSNAAYQVIVTWSARSPNSSTPTGAAGGRAWATCYNSGSTSNCGSYQSDTTSTEGNVMCGGASSPSNPGIVITNGSGGCFLVEVACSTTLYNGNIDWDLDVEAIHN